MTYIPAEAAALSTEGDTAPNYGGIPGLPDGIAWRPAITAALLLAIPAGVLCSTATSIGASLGLFWMSGAAAWTVGLYFKRARPGRISLGSGARIGLVTGLFTCWLTLGVNGLILWAGRFVLHQGGQMDADWTTAVSKVLDLYQQMFTQMGFASNEITKALQVQRLMMLSPEGRAGAALSNIVVGGAFLMLFSIIGGALGARFLAQPRRPSA